jgi:hypothetical protein
MILIIIILSIDLNRSSSEREADGGFLPPGLQNGLFHSFAVDATGKTLSDGNPG